MPGAKLIDKICQDSIQNFSLLHSDKPTHLRGYLLSAIMLRDVYVYMSISQSDYTLTPRFKGNPRIRAQRGSSKPANPSWSKARSER